VRRSGTGPILLSQATFLLAHIANIGPVPLYVLRPALCPRDVTVPLYVLGMLPSRFMS
jgi:hypothetical protein